MSDHWYTDCKMVVNDIIEVKRPTSRKSGYIKIAVDEQTIEAAIEHLIKRADILGESIFPMAGLSLCWVDQRKKGEIND